MTTTLLRGASHESEKAKKELKKTNVEFREVYSSSSGEPPILITQSSAYAVKGFASIREFCNNLNQSVVEK